MAIVEEDPFILEDDRNVDMAPEGDACSFGGFTYASIPGAPAGGIQWSGAYVGANWPGNAEF